MASSQDGKIIYQGVLHSINVSKGGVPKSEIEEGQVRSLGIEGDGHNDKKNHGGQEKALSIFSKEAIDELSDRGYNIFPGALGENLTLAASDGFNYSRISPGNIVSIGPEVKIQVMAYDQPCSKISFYLTPLDSDKPNLTEVLQEKNPGRSRFYAKVLKEGKIKKGDEVRIEKK